MSMFLSITGKAGLHTSKEVAGGNWIFQVKSAMPQIIRKMEKEKTSR